MTSKQFYSEEGQKLVRLQSEHDDLLNRQGYYSKGVSRLAERIRKQTEQVEKLYPEEKTITEQDWQKTNKKIKRNWQKLITVLCIALFLSSCSTSYKPVKAKGKTYIGHSGKNRCSAATARNSFTIKN